MGAGEESLIEVNWPPTEELKLVREAFRKVPELVSVKVKDWVEAPMVVDKARLKRSHLIASS